MKYRLQVLQWRLRQHNSIGPRSGDWEGQHLVVGLRWVKTIRDRSFWKVVMDMYTSSVANRTIVYTWYGFDLCPLTWRLKKWRVCQCLCSLTLSSRVYRTQSLVSLSHYGKDGIFSSTTRKPSCILQALCLQVWLAHLCKMDYVLSETLYEADEL